MVNPQPPIVNQKLEPPSVVRPPLSVICRLLLGPHFPFPCACPACPARPACPVGCAGSLVVPAQRKILFWQNAYADFFGFDTVGRRENAEQYLTDTGTDRRNCLSGEVMTITKNIKFGTGFIEKILIYILVLSVVFLCLVAYKTQKYVWNIDM